MKKNESELCFFRYSEISDKSLAAAEGICKMLRETKKDLRTCQCKKAKQDLLCKAMQMWFREDN